MLDILTTILKEKKNFVLEDYQLIEKQHVFLNLRDAIWKSIYGLVKIKKTDDNMKKWCQYRKNNRNVIWCVYRTTEQIFVISAVMYKKM